MCLYFDIYLAALTREDLELFFTKCQGLKFKVKVQPRFLFVFLHLQTEVEIET